MTDDLCLVLLVIAVPWQWLWQHGKPSVEALYVREDTLPVRLLHTYHVIDLEQWRYIGTLPAHPAHLYC